MRTVPAALQASLDDGATTLARCWKIERQDGLTFGFTDHDRNLEFDGLTFEPESGFTASSIEASNGLAPGSHDVSGILKSDRINATDLLRGMYSGADVSVFLVDWSDTSSRMLLSRGQIGAIKRNGITFEAEIVGLSDLLNQPFGRAYVHSCECRLGDAKCGIDLASPELAATGTVGSTNDPYQFSVDGLEAFQDGWFTGGELRWLDGANAGSNTHVKIHQNTLSGTLIEPWLTPDMQIATGDRFQIMAGCDKTVSECQAKFDNLLNFRGFPHMPGDDVVASYPTSDGGHTGGSLLR